MRALMLIVAIVVAGVALADPSGAQEPALRGNRQAGAQLADRVCSACHVVAQHQELAPLVAHTAPTFYAIAKRKDTTAASLAAFLAHPHPMGKMPYPQLTARQIADVSAYILSLRRRR
jgi:mono/diheme cytochrome c family protein